MELFSARLSDCWTPLLIVLSVTSPRFEISDHSNCTGDKRGLISASLSAVQENCGSE